MLCDVIEDKALGLADIVLLGAVGIVLALSWDSARSELRHFDRLAQTTCTATGTARRRK